MASITLPMFLAVIAASLCFAPGSLGLVTSQSWGGGSEPNNLMRFTYEAHATEPGDWEMSAYANVDKNPVDEPEGLLIKNATNAKDVDFVAAHVELSGFGGCEGEKKYPCFFVKRDGILLVNKCLNLPATCFSPNHEGGVDKYLVKMGFSGYPMLVSGSTTDIKVKLTYKGSHAPGSGKWKMSVYGSATKNPGKEALIQTHQVLNEQDQNAGDTVDFTSNEVVLTGMNGCSGDNYACYIVYRGTKMMNSGCMKFAPLCPAH